MYRDLITCAATSPISATSGWTIWRSISTRPRAGSCCTAEHSAIACNLGPDAVAVPATGDVVYAWGVPVPVQPALRSTALVRRPAPALSPDLPPSGRICTRHAAWRRTDTAARGKVPPPWDSFRSGSGTSASLASAVRCDSPRSASAPHQTLQVGRRAQLDYRRGASPVSRLLRLTYSRTG